MPELAISESTNRLSRRMDASCSRRCRSRSFDASARASAIPRPAVSISAPRPVRQRRERGRTVGKLDGVEAVVVVLRLLRALGAADAVLLVALPHRRVLHRARRDLHALAERLCPGASGARPLQLHCGATYLRPLGKTLNLRRAPSAPLPISRSAARTWMVAAEALSPLDEVKVARSLLVVPQVIELGWRCQRAVASLSRTFRQNCL